MSSNAAATRSGTAAAAQPQQQRTDWKWTLARALIMYAGVNAVTNPKSPVAGYINKLFGREFVDPVASSASSMSAASAVAPSPTAGVEGGASVPTNSWVAPPAVKGPDNVAVPLWNDDVELDFYIYISSDTAPSAEMVKTQLSDLIPESGLAHAPAIPFDAFPDLLHDPLHEGMRHDARIVYSSSVGTKSGKQELKPMAAVKWSHIRLADLALSRDVDLVLPLDDAVRKHNGSVWADMVVTQQGVSPDPRDASHHPLGVFRRRKLLSRLMPLKKKRVEKNLFDKANTTSSSNNASQDIDQEEQEEKVKIVGHWHRNLTLALVQDQGDLGVQLSQLPPPLLQHVSVVRDPSSGEMVAAPPPADAQAAALLEQAYAAGRPPNVLRYPTVFPNDFWLLKQHMHPINETVDELPLHVQLYHQSWFKFQMLASLSDSFDKQAAGGGATGSATGSEIDMIKTMLLETNPWFLALTIVVSILHSVFEFLAFSSDVRHWKNKDDLAGVSVGSIVTNIVVQLIITLYLLDNNEDTSWMILAGQAVGVVVECWKLTKAVSVGVVAAPNSVLGYRLKISDKHKLSVEEKKTQEYDRLAFKYVGIAVGPLLVGYTIYSALYQTHRGWWSFIISTATSFVYAFGFVSLVPQLIVNYKLKSTAGMNSKTFVYKILGTFVDDMFAFCIKMPMLHRLACFRDDVVFFVALYQRWIYGVDPTRRNEFGQTLEKKDGQEKDGQDEGVGEDKEGGAKSSALQNKAGGLKSRGKAAAATSGEAQ
ncbi:hypothetical protein EX895_005247 [Sporisorium graminicola]|uniref:Cleft lip and palate transmembrane protein 1 n=1 Tax=Sporisorium graminicola TaxID=280036 RepID=A0A4U7KPE5_9BASI|nr:hypothetical protein EX895_005247 [Sporisorium graminicola]TKY85707.1 hypothetical protein EX895_005247 [Sporisorium graminicola]